MFLTLCGISSLPAEPIVEHPLWDSLTPDQQQLLLDGKPVETEENVIESPWPRFRIYSLVKASPQDVASVFWNCELDAAYIPNCISVRILNRPEPSVHEAEYTLKMPFFLPDEVYTSRNSLKKIAPDSYEISWKVLASIYTKFCTGNLRIEQHGEYTLIRYTNLVIPKSRIAGLLRSTAGTQVNESVHALVRQVSSELEKDPALLEHQRQELEKSLLPPTGEASK
jgi:hypothetical protein